MADTDKKRKSTSIRGHFLRMEVFFLVIVVGGFSLLYFLFADRFYVFQKSNLMREAFLAVSEGESMEAESLEDLVSGYEDANFRFKILDDENSSIYCTGFTQRISSMENDERENWEELYEEEPAVEYNKYQIILRGRFARGERTYYVRITENTKSAGSSFAYTDAFLALLLALSVVVGIVMMWLITNRLLHSIENINQVADHISRRDFSQRADENTDYRELRELAESINRMSDEIQDSLVCLEETNQVLVEENRYKEKLNRMREEFMGNISHELKTPLAIMSNHVELLQCMGDQIDRDYYYNSLMDEIDNMSEIVENLLEISSVEQGLDNMEKVPVNLSVTAKRLREKSLALIERRKAALEFTCEEDLIVLGAERYLSQAMENYLTNAVKHVREGGTIRFALTRDGEDILCTVFNEGENIPEESLDTIWKSFVVLEEDNVSDEGIMSNTGLGLYIVQKIVVIHHGTCGVENREDGVLFWLRIPAYTEEEN